MSPKQLYLHCMKNKFFYYYYLMAYCIYVCFIWNPKFLLKNKYIRINTRKYHNQETGIYRSFSDSLLMFILLMLVNIPLNILYFIFDISGYKYLVILITLSWYFQSFSKIKMADKFDQFRVLSKKEIIFKLIVASFLFLIVFLISAWSYRFIDETLLD